MLKIVENPTNMILRANKVLVCLLFLLQGSSVHTVVNAKLPYSKCFEDVAHRYSLDREWLIAISIVESSLNPRAISSSDAIGLMQIKWPITAKHLGVNSRDKLFEPCVNIDLGGKYLRELLDRYKDDLNQAASAYRIGPTALDNARTVPAMALEYLERIRDQMDLLKEDQPESEKSREKANASIMVETNEQRGVGVFGSPVDQNPKPTMLRNNISNRPRSDSCNLGELQMTTLTTHVPAIRERRFLLWLQDNASSCDTKKLTRIRNQIPVWLGTADTALVREELESFTKNQ